MLTNRINRLTVRNYRSLADVTVDFEDLTVLVGPNGSGKSNILDVLRFVRDALTLGLDKALQDRGGIMSIRRFSPNGELYDIEITLDLKFGEQHASYAFVLASSEQNTYQVKSEKASLGSLQYEITDDKFDKFNLDSPSSSHIINVGRLALSLRRMGYFMQLTPLHEFLGRFESYSIIPETFRLPQKMENVYPLSETGDNLATFLRYTIK